MCFCVLEKKTREWNISDRSFRTRSFQIRPFWLISWCCTEEPPFSWEICDSCADNSHTRRKSCRSGGSQHLSGYLLRISPNIHYYSAQQHSSVYFLLSCSVKLEDVCLPLELFFSPETVRNSRTSEATLTFLTVGSGRVFVVWLKPDVIASFTRRNDSTLLNEGDLLFPAPFIKLSPHE